MKKLVFIAFVCVFVALPVMADLTNGSFETGDLTGWSTVVPTGGSVSVVTSHSDTSGIGTGTLSWSSVPPGEHFALIKTNDEIGTATELYQIFSASAGDSLSFDYFWDCWENQHPNYDSALIYILEGTEPVTVWEEWALLDPDRAWGSPWKHITYTFTSPGTYKIWFQIWNRGEESSIAYPSFIGVDNVMLTPVPVPAAIILVVLGLGAAGIKLRKFA